MFDKLLEKLKLNPDERVVVTVVRSLADSAAAFAVVDESGRYVALIRRTEGEIIIREGQVSEDDG